MGLKKTTREVFDAFSAPKRAHQADAARNLVKIARETRNTPASSFASQAAEGNASAQHIVNAKLMENRLKSEKKDKSRAAMKYTRGLY